MKEIAFLKTSQLDLLSLISGNPCAEGATVPAKPDTVSGLWVERKHITSYTDDELRQMRPIAVGKLQEAQSNYAECSRYKKAHWRKEIRNWGHKWANCSREMAKRGILRDPKGKWSQPSGRKGDAAR